MEHVQTLIFCDMMLLGQYEHDGDKYLVLWIDFDERDFYHVFPVDDVTLSLYLEGRVPLLDLLECAPVIYRTDSPETLFEGQHDIVCFSAIPENEKPTADSFFERI